MRAAAERLVNEATINGDYGGDLRLVADILLVARFALAAAQEQPSADLAPDPRDGEIERLKRYAASKGEGERTWQRISENTTTEHDATLAELTRLREALAYYADEQHYDDEHEDDDGFSGLSSIDQDGGDRARAALAAPASAAPDAAAESGGPTYERRPQKPGDGTIWGFLDPSDIK